MFFKKRKNYELDLEEILGPVRGEKFMELSLTGPVFKAFYLLMVLAALIFVSRLLFLWKKEGDFYSRRALANANQEIILPASRGIIFDRFMKPLAQNQPVFSVSLKISEYLKNRAEIEQFLYETLGLSAHDLNDIVSLADLEKSGSVIVARDLEPEELLKLKTKEMPGIQISDDFRRFYPQKYAFSHVLGYVDFEGHARAGLESAYDDTLTGIPGLILKQRNSKGQILADDRMLEPKNGSALLTTLDADLEEYFYNRLLAGLNSLGKQSGAGLAIDPRNGEILAAVSFPAYDNNLFTKKGNSSEKAQKLQILESKDNPLFTRFVSGVYNPGSTIKPLHAVAALAENIIDTQKSIFSKGYIEIPNPYFPDKPSVFKDWKPNGWVNLYSALARSSNIYFYSIGGGFEDQRGLGIDKIIEWWKKFGLGRKTSIDFPGESDGFLPNPGEKERRTGSPWRIGDTYNVSIGQGDLLVTPLQLLTYIASIANGGKLYEPHFKKTDDVKLTADLSYLGPYMKEVERGMEDVVAKDYGTAHSLSSLPFKVAAKTGTAQIDNNTKTNAFFVGYAPVPDDPNLKDKHSVPEIAILVLVENAKEGSLNTIPIANDVLYWYYVHRIANSQ